VAVPIVILSWRGQASYPRSKHPLRAQWEKAARGGLAGKEYPWGNTVTHDNANYYGKGGRDQWSETSPVGSFPTNGYGLFDMAGNVWEWCADEFDPDYYNESPENNPTGPGTPVLFVNNDFIKARRHHPSRSRGNKTGNGYSPKMCLYSKDTICFRRG